VRLVIKEIGAIEEHINIDTIVILQVKREEKKCLGATRIKISISKIKPKN